MSAPSHLTAARIRPPASVIGAVAPRIPVPDADDTRTGAFRSGHEPGDLVAITDTAEAACTPWPQPAP
jgi:hypothetical protein